MRKKPSKKIEKYRIKKGKLASHEIYGNNGHFNIPSPQKGILFVRVSDGGGWDHVSVSLFNRTPTWKEMCFIKDLFFEPEETVIQYHPPESKYINHHPFVLHMWKPQGIEILLPPIEFV